MYRVGNVHNVSLFATRDITSRPPAAVAPPGAFALAGCQGGFR
jgi:hypothetical protein